MKELYYLAGHVESKLTFLSILSLYLEVFWLSVKFSFSTKGNRSVLYIFCLIGFCGVLFLIQDENSNGLNVEFPNKSSS